MFSASFDVLVGTLFFHDASVRRKTQKSTATHYGQVRLQNKLEISCKIHKVLSNPD